MKTNGLNQEAYLSHCQKIEDICSSSLMKLNGLPDNVSFEMMHCNFQHIADRLFKNLNHTGDRLF
jgi:hypothetical protein